MDTKFPIRDVQFHEEGLRAAASLTVSKEEAIAISWHSTAIAYLQYGAFNGFNGPATEREIGGQIEAVEIEDFLVPATDSHGITYFKHVFKNR